MLRKAREQGFETGTPAIHSPEERKLILQLLSLPDCLEGAEAKRAPNMLCEYSFELAQNFSRFYGAHHVLSEPDSALRASRLGLCVVVLAVLTGVLELLGIEVPERM
jgi:arginyl-tRNA synthetase